MESGNCLFVAKDGDRTHAFVQQVLMRRLLEELSFPAIKHPAHGATLRNLLSFPTCFDILR